MRTTHVLFALAIAAVVAAGGTFGPDFAAPFVLDHSGEKMFVDIFSRVDRTHKTSQLKFLVYVADGPGPGMMSGPMSRMEAETEMKLYVDADATLMVEDGHGGFIDINTRQPMQNLLAARDPVDVQ